MFPSFAQSSLAADSVNSFPWVGDSAQFSDSSLSPQMLSDHREVEKFSEDQSFQTKAHDEPEHSNSNCSLLGSENVECNASVTFSQEPSQNSGANRSLRGWDGKTYECELCDIFTGSYASVVQHEKICDGVKPGQPPQPFSPLMTNFGSHPAGDDESCTGSDWENYRYRRGMRTPSADSLDSLDAQEIRIIRGYFPPAPYASNAGTPPLTCTTPFCDLPSLVV